MVDIKIITEVIGCEAFLLVITKQKETGTLKRVVTPRHKKMIIMTLRANYIAIWENTVDSCDI
jgi:hypothetical protein